MTSFTDKEILGQFMDALVTTGLVSRLLISVSAFGVAIAIRAMIGVLRNEECRLSRPR